MAMLTALGVLDSFSEVIPGAADQHQAYLKAVAGAVQQQGLPVQQAIEQISASAGLFAAAMKRQCLAVVPAGKRLAPYKTLHYATPIGVNLAVGWYLLGGQEAAAAESSFLIRGLNSIEFADLQAIIQCVHQFAVMPAVYQIADTVKYDRKELAKKSGFFGA